MVESRWKTHKIQYTGKNMQDFPPNPYGCYCSGLTSAYEVINIITGKRVFVGSYHACENYMVW